MQKNLSRTTLLGLAALCTAAGTLSAQGATVTPRSQKRCVKTAAVFQTPTNASACASGFGAFDQTVHLGWASRYEPWSLDSSQRSQIGASSITATGMVGLAFANSFVTGSTTNEFSVTFRLAQPVTFTLDGSLVWDGAYGPFGSQSPVVRLTGPQGVVFEGTALNDAAPVPFSTSGTLPAGQYVLEAYAGSASDFGGGETMNYEVGLQVVPVAPPVYPGQVYLLNGTLNGLVPSAGSNTPVAIAAHDLVNVALGRSLSDPTVSTTQLLALVSDNLDRSVRMVVWDKTTTNVAVEVGPLAFQSGLVQSNSYTGIADQALNNNGRLVDTADTVKSRLTLVAKGLFDTNGTITTLIGSPVIGQLNVIDDVGHTNTVLIKGGSLSTGRKLGTTP